MLEKDLLGHQCHMGHKKRACETGTKLVKSSHDMGWMSKISIFNHKKFIEVPKKGYRKFTWGWRKYYATKNVNQGASILTKLMTFVLTFLYLNATSIQHHLNQYSVVLFWLPINFQYFFTSPRNRNEALRFEYPENNSGKITILYSYGTPSYATKKRKKK